MNRVLTTLAILALAVTAANAQIRVTCNGEPVENGGEVVLNNESFVLNEDLVAMGWWYWEASVDVEIEAEGESNVLATTTSEHMQLCEANGNCFPWSNGEIDRTFTSSKYGLAIHRGVQEEKIPELDETMTLRITDISDNTFVFTIKVATTDRTGTIADVCLSIVNGSKYAPVVLDEAEKLIVYNDIRLEDMTRMIIISGDLTFGWPEVEDTASSDVVTNENPVTELVVYPTRDVLTQLEGIYDIFVTFNEDMTGATMKFEKKQEIYPYVNIKLENGASFNVRGEYGKDARFVVSTGDPYWGVVGYECSTGESGTFESPEMEVHGTIPYLTGNIDYLLFTQYLGEFEILDESDEVVEIGNNVTISRISDGVNVRGLSLNDEVAVYTLGGQLIQLVKAHDSDMTIHLEKGQVYIVRCGEVAAKVVM